jgi:glucan biosynthesis protein C
MENSTLGTNNQMPIAVEAQPKGSSRLLFVDNIRVYLTILVLLHHLMITYAWSGDWYYKEGEPDLVTSALGLWFCAINQAYFMGLFLLISAYFVPGSYDRKGAIRFVKDRLIRLGIPLAVFSWIINPLFIYVGLVLSQDLQMPLFRFFPIEYFKTEPLIGAGPLWFVEVLLIFSLVYVLWRLLVPPISVKKTREAHIPENGVIALFALLLGLAGFLVRLVFPIDYTFKPLNLQFPFFAQYIALFVVGLIAYSRNWFKNLPDKVGRFWVRVALVLILLWFPLVLAEGILTDDSLIKGGYHWQSLVYALWESIFCLSMCIGLIYAFRRYLNRQGKVAVFLVPNAYTAYIIHAPVITTLAFAVKDIALYPLLKWIVVALVAIPLCFGLSALIRKIPYTDRVL